MASMNVLALHLRAGWGHAKTRTGTACDAPIPVLHSMQNTLLCVLVLYTQYADQTRPRTPHQLLPIIFVALFEERLHAKHTLLLVWLVP